MLQQDMKRYKISYLYNKFSSIQALEVVGEVCSYY